MQDLFQQLHREKQAIDALKQKLINCAANDEDCQRLQTIPGYGPIVSSAIVAAVGNAVQFEKGRQLSAWTGLTPRHAASGEKIIMLSTSKAGNPYLRCLMIHGARSVVNWSHKKDDRLSLWIQRLVARRGKQKATVALANKSARIAWVLLTKKETYKVSALSSKK